MLLHRVTSEVLDFRAAHSWIHDVAVVLFATGEESVLQFRQFESIAPHPLWSLTEVHPIDEVGVPPRPCMDVDRVGRVDVPMSYRMTL
jgi:hypothetical protein